MAQEKFTGVSAGTVVSVDGTPMPGWRKVRITEKGLPLPTPMDTTQCQDATYQFTDDPLGGKTAPSSDVSVEGLLSVADHQDTGGWFALALGTAYAVVVTTKTAGDEWTQADMVFKTFKTGAAVAEMMPFTATFTHSTLAGAWGTDS